MTTRDLRTVFIRLYKGMPPSYRSRIVLELDGQPYTWNPIYVEVYNNTALGIRMLEKLNLEGKI